MSAGMSNITQPSGQHEPPPHFRRFDDAYNWLSDHGWRVAGPSRGSHFRFEHPRYSKALFLIYKPGSAWGPFQEMQIAKRLRKLDALYRRPERADSG